MSGLASMENMTSKFKKSNMFSENMNSINLQIDYSKMERYLLKIFLLTRLHQVFCELFSQKSQLNSIDCSKEYYLMDSKVIQLIIQGIVDTGEYTLEGISYHTHIPFDIIFEAACGIRNQLSITCLVRIIDLFIQVKPDVLNALVEKLLELKNKNSFMLSSLLHIK